MNCKKCGSPLVEGSLFCNNCGEKVETETVIETPKEEPVVLPEPNVEPVSTPEVTETPVTETPAVEPVVEPTVETPVEPVVEPTVETPAEPTIETPEATPIITAAETVNQTVPEIPKKKSNAALIIIIIAASVLLLGGIAFAVIKFVIPKFIPETPVIEQTEETVNISGYTYTIPSVFSKIEVDGVEVIGNENFYFKTENVKVLDYTYSELVAAKNDIATQLTKDMPSSMTYLGAKEETFAGQKYLIYRASFLSDSKTYYSDVIFTELPNKKIFRTTLQYDSDYMNTGYTNLSSFIKSAKEEDAETTTNTTTNTTNTTTNTTTTTDDYMVVGTDTLGYLKLPGEWRKTKIEGSSDTSLQYVEMSSYTGSSATGSWIVTLNVLDKAYTTSAKEAANNEAAYFNTDSDASNVKVEQATMGKYKAYKLYCQYKSDKVWVVTWYFEAEDGLVHIIQVEGLDLTKDYFKIPETFSLTKAN